MKFFIRWLYFSIETCWLLLRLRLFPPKLVRMPRSGIYFFVGDEAEMEMALEQAKEGDIIWVKGGEYQSIKLPPGVGMARWMI